MQSYDCYVSDAVGVIAMVLDMVVAVVGGGLGSAVASTDLMAGVRGMEMAQLVCGMWNSSFRHRCRKHLMRVTPSRIRGRRNLIFVGRRRG
jgi:hypothetical protein